MTALPDVLRQSELLNQLVLDRTTMEELGRVEVMWMYPAAHRVLGFVCKSGAFGAKKAAFKLAQITTLGPNGLLTRDQPEATDATKVRQLESLLGCEVWSDAGNKIGKIVDYVFNLKTGSISHYLLASSGWAGIAGDLYQLPPTQVLSMGRKRVLVNEAAAQNLATYQTGIKQTLTKARTMLQEDYGQATEELRSLSEQAKGRFQSLTGQIREKARSLSQQAQETIHTINEQIQEEAQILAEQMKERTQSLGEQLEESVQTLTVQAKEIFDVNPDEAIGPDPAPSAAADSEPVQTAGTPDIGATATCTSDDDDEFWPDDDWFDDEAEPAPSPAAPSPAPATAAPPALVTDAAATQTTNGSPDADDDEPWI